MSRELEEWAELNGSYGRCPRCRKRVWVESCCGFECDGCGYTDREPEDEEKEEPCGEDDEPF